MFSGGCFWGVQAVFEHVRGVTSATSGYTGGAANTATYEEVSTSTTGHAESVRVTFDPKRVSYADLLKVFFTVAHDPTELDRQGPDEGTQYRSAVWYTSDAQRLAAEAFVRQLTADKVFSRPIVTQISPLKGFYVAEGYHQDYFVHNPDAAYIVINDKPKVERLKSALPALYSPAPVLYAAAARRRVSSNRAGVTRRRPGARLRAPRSTSAGAPTHEYADIKTNVALNPELFDVSKWSSAPHWAP